MRDKRVILLGVAAVALGLVVSWLFLLRDEVPPPAPVAPPVVAAVAKPVVVETPVVAEVPKPKPPPAAKKVSQGMVPQPVVDLPAWQEQPEAAFVPEDVKDIGGGVTLSLGNYRAGVGQEFEVLVTMAGPALETMAIPLAFDAEIAEAVPNSGKAVGLGLRRGLECNVSNKKGMVLLLQMGTPGMKNVNAVKGEIVATFKMKGKSVGKTELRLGGKTMVFANGRGDRERFSIQGGSIVIQ